MNRLYGTQYGKVVVVDLVSAMQILELAHANMEYDEKEDYDDERKGQLAALEHLALHNADPKKKGITIPVVPTSG